MKYLALATALLLAPCLAPGFFAPRLAQAQPAPAHSPGMVHAMKPGRHAPMAASPKEAGQSAFAAIAEIVSLLEADPATDWSKVNIEALRQHLIDMNAVTLEAEIAAEPIAGGARFLAAGPDRIRGAIRRMVMAHATAMNGAGGWTLKAEDTATGAALSVTAADPAAIAKIRALGLIGVLTHGMHHQSHHLMIAAGRNPHG